MTRFLLVPAALVAAAASALAQTPTPMPKIVAPMVYSYFDGASKTKLGFTTTAGGGARDTLGVLIGAVEPDGVAEKAGIEEGNRLAAINGVNLRLSAGDVGEADMTGIMSRRLQRELQKLKPGDSVEFRVWRNGRFDTVRIQVPEPKPAAMAKTTIAPNANRASIGATIGGSTSPRDTLGVFVAAVLEGGPLAKAGVFEGSRVASIAGVDLRVPAADAGDAEIATARMNRLQREVEKLEPGSNVELRVWQNGQSRTVTVQVAKRSDVYKNELDESSFLFRDGSGAFKFNGLEPLTQRFRELQQLDLPPDGNFDLRWAPSLKLMSPLLREPPRIKMDEQSLELERRLEDLQQQVRDGAGVREDLERRIEDLQKELQRVRPTTRSAAFTTTFEAPTNGLITRSFGDVPGVARDGATDGVENAVVFPGLRLSRVGAELAAYFGKDSERGYLVLDVDNSWRGLEKGDVIIAIDGKLLRDRAEVAPLSVTGKHTIDVLRGGKRLRVSIER